jgi:MFS family permease
VLPLHVHQDLGLGTFVVGLVAGAQFAASLLSRFWAGNYADSRGAKRALITGLLVAAAAGLLYSLTLPFRRQTEDIGHDPIAGPGGTRSGGEFHRDWCFQLGTGAG